MARSDVSVDATSVYSFTTEDTALDEAARQKGVSRSDVLRESLRPYLGVIRGEQGAGVHSIRRGETA